MITIEAKPLSVNRCWQGRRWKSPEYVKYEKMILWMLPKLKLPEPPYEIHLVYGFSSSASDFDNPTKPFVDILSKKYKFNDKLIKRAVIDVEMVKKGKEFISFNIKHYDNS